MKELLGVLVKDVPRYLHALVSDGKGYLSLANRTERLEPAPDGSGFRCDWKWTSDLHAPMVLPFLGRWLMSRSLRDHPIRRKGSPEASPVSPAVSFVIGHRGRSRIPLLVATLESIAGQLGCHCECIVVEQDDEPLLSGRLPGWVHHVHTPPPERDMPYCRSWAFNVGVSYAKGHLLILHDNDLLVPADYAAQALNRAERGFDVVNLKRYIFYLSEHHSRAVCDGTSSPLDSAPEAIMQNSQGGGSIVITRDAYERIGGMDESFVGWGGEDIEFWERAQTLSVWHWGVLSLLHLWHPGQPGKLGFGPSGIPQFHELSGVPVDARIAELRARGRGMLHGPTTG